MSDGDKRPRGAMTAAADVLLVSVDDGPTVPEALRSRAQAERALGLFSQSEDAGTGTYGDDSEDDDSDRLLLVMLTDTERASKDAAPAEPPPKRRIKKRRYQEVMRLRETACALERELVALKNRQESAARAIKNEDGDTDVTRWQKVAKREIQATARTRLENAKLKETLKAQVEFSKSLCQALVTKHRSIQGLQRYFLYEQGELATVQPSTPRESEIFDALLRNLFARDCDSHEFLSFNGLPAVSSLVTTHQEAAVSEGKILLNDEQALCIDLVERYVIPFDFRAGARVLWTNVVSKRLKLTEQAAHVSVSHSICCWMNPG